MTRHTLREQVLENLRAAIIGGAMRPGTPLVETELAEAYGVSRGTVREALRFLQESGLVDIDARGRLRVHVPDATEIRDVFHVRAALEGLALRAVISSPQRAKLATELRARLPPPAGDGDFAEILNLDLAFHEHLCRVSGNATLLDTWKRLEGRMRVVLFSTSYTKPVALMSRDQHMPIVAAVENSDLAAATDLIYAHMNTAAEHWVRQRLAKDTPDM